MNFFYYSYQAEKNLTLSASFLNLLHFINNYQVLDILGSSIFLEIKKLRFNVNYMFAFHL